MKPLPLYAAISGLGNLFTLTYAPHGTTAYSCCQGYDEDVFAEARGSGIPLVDFRTMDFTGYNFPGVREAHAVNFGGELPLVDWIANAQRRGATITTL